MTTQEHDIVLENIIPIVENVRYPRCTAGRRQPPPEHRPENWPLPNEPVFLKNSVTFRDPNVVWMHYPFKGF